jgi:hypothetical protein
MKGLPKKGERISKKPRNKGRGLKQWTRTKRWSSVLPLIEQIKAINFGSGQGANHSDSAWYREDLQCGHDPKGAVLCSRKSGTLY